MKKLDISNIKVTPLQIIACVDKINEIINELKKHDIIKIEEKGGDE